jgi:anhydro-N-acetylmuramic acid kinase
MKDHVAKLYNISGKKERHIIGLMSGTSLDGLDVALCALTGTGVRTQVKVLHFETIGYDEDFRNEIRRVFAKKEIDFQHLTLLNVIIANHHANLINACLGKWEVAADTVDLIASHGQTVFHAPKILHGLDNYPNATLQIGDGDQLAVKTGIITVSDFRQKHVAAGGEGAPLALYGDYYLFSKPGTHRILLNIGGIANFTYLPADSDASKVFATDTGPGNTLLNAFAKSLFNVPFDENGWLAAAGTPNPGLLTLLKSDPFFAKAAPKTTGPEMFSSAWVEKALEQMPKGHNNPYDIMATLARLSAESIADTINGNLSNLSSETQLFVSGGGAHNPVIMSHLKDLLPTFQILPMDELGVDGDAKEAVLFAVLANEAIAGQTEEGARLGGIPLIGMGKISFPA